MTWTVSDGFTSLAREHAGQGGRGGSMTVIVQAAVSGLLVQLGHAVTKTPDGRDLVVLAGTAAAPSAE